MGEVALSGALGPGGATRLKRLRQAGSLKALFPTPGGPALEAVTLNTAGGLTGGDRTRLSAAAGPGARLVLTTQAAERAYRAAGDAPARAETALEVGAGGRLDWLPQETILFEGCRLERRLRLDLAASATALLVEPLVFGRLARGEVLRDARLSDRWEVRRGGRLVFVDALWLSGDVAATLDRAGVAGGARALASVLYVGPDAEARLAVVRKGLRSGSGASLIRDGVLFARLLAPDGFALRAALVPLILGLMDMALPKVWRL